MHGHDCGCGLTGAEFRALLDVLSETVLVADACGEVRGEQPSWARYTGQTAEESAGLGWCEAFDVRDRTAMSETWTTGVRAGEPFAVAARLFDAVSGASRHCEGRVTPMRDGGEVTAWIMALSDVHERHLHDQRERATAERFRRVFAANVFGICAGEQDRIVDGNDAFLGAIGASRLALRRGISVHDLEIRDAHGTLGMFADGEAREYEIRRLDGAPGHLLAAGVDLAPDPGWLAVVVDLTQRKATERAIAHLALHDPLTGLPNRRLLGDRLRHALARAARHRKAVAVLFCDLDHFKRINDTHGHGAGDTVLQMVARRLESILRDDDTVARAGGDEFVIVLEDLADPTEATRIAERARLALIDPIAWEHRALRITASLGVSVNIGADDTVEALLGRADTAMYAAKQAGRNQVAFAAPDFDPTRGINAAP